MVGFAFTRTLYRLRSPIVGRQRLVPLLQHVLPRRVVHFAAANEDMLRLGRELERIATPDNDVRVLSWLQRADAIRDAEDFGRRQA